MRYLKKLKEEITTKYSKKIQKESATEEQKTEYENAKKELEEKEKGLVEPNKSFLFRIFRRKLYKKQVEDYNKGLADIESAKKRASSAGLVIEQKETAVQQLQEKMQEELAIFEGMNLDVSKNSAVKQKSLLDNEQYASSCRKIREYIDEMIRIDPELVYNTEFMTACVEFDMSLITLDKTNSPEVYQTFLNEYAENELDDAKLNSEGWTLGQKTSMKNLCRNLLEEITNPKEVAAGKFKIPHKYIFERIRAAYSPDAKTLGIGEVCDYAYTAYADFDGKLSYAEGKKFEELLENEDSYLYLHTIKHAPDATEEDKSKRIDAVQHTGLMIEPGERLSSITINTKDSRLDLLNVLKICDGVDIAVAQVPKTEIDGKSPIIGYPDDEPDASGWLLPKYIVGSVRGGEYVANSVSAEEMDKYALLASDGNRPTKAQQLTSN